MKHIYTVLFLALAACQPVPEEVVVYQEVAWSDVPTWNNLDNLTVSYEAFLQSCIAFDRKPKEKLLDENHVFFGTYGDWQNICEYAKRIEIGDFKSFVETYFKVVFIKSENGGLFTGYYTPVLKGSFGKSDKYSAPLYSKPVDLLTADLGLFDDAYKGKRIVARVEGRRIIPYYTREELKFQNEDALLWLQNDVDAFFLHVQGSGWVQLPNGQEIHVGYAGDNGHRYHAIGRTLIEKGYLTKEEVTMQSIRDWLLKHPEETDDILNSNPRYIFFRLTEGQTKGSLNVPLTEGYSLAVDPNYIPLGIPLIVSTTETYTNEPIQRLMMAQDTGAAINGSVRGDIYYGRHNDAELKAGAQNADGHMYALVPVL